MKQRVDGRAELWCLLFAAWASACSGGGTNAANGGAGPTAGAGSAAGSGPSAGAGSTAGAAPTAGDDETDPLAVLPAGSAQLEVLCARHNGDPVAQAFCASSPPTIASLRDLQLLFGLDVTDPHSAMAGLVTQSTSLARRLTTPINPRAIVVPFSREFVRNVPEGERHPNPTWVTLAFVRGEQFVELAAKDPTANDAVRFYLFNFEQQCNRTAVGCIPADLFTPDGEKHITSYTLYEDVDLANTSLDCTQCHQIQGPGTPKKLIHQEFGYSWGHWAMQGEQVPELAPLCKKYNEMHAADEDYFGIPNAYLGCTRGPRLTEIGGPSNGGPQALDQFLYDNSQEPAYDPQLSFHGKAVFNEIGYDGSNGQPEVNVPIGISPTWQALYDTRVPGQTLEFPYHDLYNTDAQKMSTVIEAYRAVMAGTRPRSELPDMSDLLVKEGLADMSITPQPNLSGRQILSAMCTQCHNSRVDPSLSRSRFDVERLDQLSRTVKDEAIRRLHLPPASARHMPPHRFHDLSTEQVELVSQELMR